MKRIALFLFLILSVINCFAQTQIDPTYQIAWNLLSGAGAPTITCTQNGNYTVYPYGAEWGQSYQDTTNNAEYKCTTSGWVKNLPATGGTLTGPLVVGTGAPSITLDGSTGNGTFSGTVTAGTTNGQINAAQQQTPAGTGNNGIANSFLACLAAPSVACSMLAPANYAQTEAQPWGLGNVANSSAYPTVGPLTSTPKGCLTDWRWGVPQVICHEGSPLGDNRHFGQALFAQAITDTGTGTSTHTPGALFLQQVVFGGTRDLPNDETNVTAFQTQSWTHSSASQSLNTGTLFGYAPSDAIGLSISDYSSGATLAQNEGMKAIRIRLGELGNVVSGTLNSSTCGVTCTLSMTQLIGAGGLGSNLAIIDLSQSYTTGYVSNRANGTVTGTGTNWDSAFGLTTAQTTFTSAISNSSGTTTATAFSVTSNVVTLTAPNVYNANAEVVGISGCSNATWLNGNSVTILPTGLSSSQFSFAFTHANTSGSDTCTVTPTGNTFPQLNVSIAVASSSGFSVGYTACEFNNNDYNWDCNHITAVPDGTHITVDEVDYPFVANSTVAAGGATGMGFSFPADWANSTAPNGESISSENGPSSNMTIRQVFPIVSNSTGNVLTLYTSALVNGNFASKSYFYSPNLTGSGGTATVTISGGAITSCTASGGTNYNTNAVPWIMLSGITYTSTPMVYPLVATGGSGSLSGCVVQYPGAGIVGTPIVTVNDNPYVIYPQTRALSVYNSATGAVDGSAITTTPLVGTFNVTDNIEQEHFFRAKLTGFNAVDYQYQPPGQQNNIYITSGGSFGPNDYEAAFINNNDPTMYFGYPAVSLVGNIPGRGGMGTPYGIDLEGPHQYGLHLGTPPYGSAQRWGVVVTECGTDAQCQAWNVTYPFLNAEGWNSGLAKSTRDMLGYNPTTESWTLTAGSTDATPGNGAACSLILTPTGVQVNGTGCSNTGSVATVGPTSKPVVGTNASGQIIDVSTAAAIPNTALANTSTTVNGQSCALGGSCSVSVTTGSAFKLGGVPLDNTGNTTKNFLAAITIPAGTMGATSQLHIVARASACSSTANVPTSTCTGSNANTGTCQPVMYFSNSTGSLSGNAIFNGPTLSATKPGTIDTTITNLTASTQIIDSAGNGSYFGTQYGTVPATINTASTTYIQFGMTNSVAADNCFFDSAFVQLIP